VRSQGMRDLLSNTSALWARCGRSLACDPGRSVIAQDYLSHGMAAAFSDGTIPTLPLWGVVHGCGMD